jgi:5-methylcytosine-specific restriction endonuclease McrA
MLICLKCRNHLVEIDLSPSDEVHRFSVWSGGQLFTDESWCVCSNCKGQLRIEILAKYPIVNEKPEYMQDLLLNAIYDLYRKKVVSKKYAKSRSEISKLLPSTLSRREITKLREYAVCPLTGETEDLTMDHFIPLNWGHGGLYRGNIFFVSRKLNSSKSKENPFRWIRWLTRYEEINKKGWDALVIELAKENELTKKEFKEFVDWCEDNQRSIEQLRFDNTPSLQLWCNSLH